MPADRAATRRDFLRATAAGAAGLALGAEASGGLRPPLAGGTAKSCIFINLVGGPSHLDTFDPKPDAPAEVRGPFRPIPTRVPGLHLSELFPKLAAVADTFTLVRGMHHDGPPVHEAGLQLLNTGRLFRDGPEWPNVGAVMSYLCGQRAGRCPTWMLLPHDRVTTGISVSHGLGTGWLPRAVVGPGLTDPTRSGPRHSPWVALSGAGIMAAAGHAFVTVNTHTTVFDAVSWDCHAAGGSLATTLDDYRDTVAPEFDEAFADLLHSLEQDGRLDSTLVVATGEFGRTPYLNGSGGRDHWAGCWTA
ncbi:MAG: DUF1501 domain-containing protein, partial [Gemmataceae bacterium]|nr:DUF1501 domain-containing protein [Gemmataceae bacterium]